MMRRGASLDADQARRQLLEERQDVTPLQLTANDHLTSSINNRLSSTGGNEWDRV
jgi:hypothetical protein